MSTWTIYRRLFLLARPYWLHLAGLFALTLVAVPITLLTPLPLKIAVDSAVGNEPLPGLLAPLGSLLGGPAWRAALALAIGLMILVTLVGQLQQASRALLNTFLSNRLLLHFRSELLGHVHRLSLSYHDSKGAGCHRTLKCGHCGTLQRRPRGRVGEYGFSCADAQAR